MQTKENIAYSQHTHVGPRWILPGLISGAQIGCPTGAQLILFSVSMESPHVLALMGWWWAPVGLHTSPTWAEQVFPTRGPQKFPYMGWWRALVGLHTGPISAKPASPMWGLWNSWVDDETQLGSAPVGHSRCIQYGLNYITLYPIKYI